MSDAKVETQDITRPPKELVKRLEGIGSRMKTEYLRQFIANPPSVKPGSIMPRLFKDGEEEKSMPSLPTW